MRKVLIWMPKVWVTRATRVGRRRIKAAMVKGVQGEKKTPTSIKCDPFHTKRYKMTENVFSCFKSNLKFPPKVTGLVWT